MRLSTDPSDRGYPGVDFRAKCYLDGKEIHGVITSDEEEGYVLRLVPQCETPPSRFLIVDGELVKEELYGKVKIEIVSWGEGV